MCYSLIGVCVCVRAREGGNKNLGTPFGFEFPDFFSPYSFRPSMNNNII